MDRKMGMLQIFEVADRTNIDMLRKKAYAVITALSGRHGYLLTRAESAVPALIESNSATAN